MPPRRNGKLDINVTYKNRSLLIKCMREEFAHEIESRFGIKLDAVIMYSVNKNKRSKITLNSITDLMKILLVPKENGLNSIQNHEETTKKMLDNIITKLRQNTSLSGPERKVLIDGLETHSTAFFNKRKLDQTDFIQPAVSNKKVQANVYADNQKESFAQTDLVNIAENHVDGEVDVIIKLKKLWQSDNKSMEEIEALMQETFLERRSFLLFKTPPVRVVKEQYPALFCLEMVKSELERLFYPGKCSEFLKNMEKYYKYILPYQVDGADKILDKIRKALDYALTPAQKTYAGIVGSVFVLAKLLEEDFGFIHLKDYPHGNGDIFPYIDASCHSLKELFSDQFLFCIVAEGNMLCEATNFLEAILCLVASFFIFNIDYPQSCRRTLTVFEKLYLEANDTTDMDELTSQMIKMCKLQACKTKDKK